MHMVEARDGTHLYVKSWGEGRPVISSVLLVVEREVFPLVDLRVDDAPEAITALRMLWDRYRPLVEVFVTRAVDPDAAPGTT